MTPKKVELEWLDSSAHPGPWITTDEIESTNLSCWTIGFLVAETPEAVTVAQSYSLTKKGDVNQWGQALTIPRCAITKGLDVAKKRK